MSYLHLFIMVSTAIIFYGCQTSQSTKKVTRQDIDTVKRVAKELTGRDVNDEELYRMGQMLQQNAQTQNAIQAITNSLTQKPNIKYCPIDGKRFAPNLTVCPDHQVELKVLED